MKERKVNLFSGQKGLVYAGALGLVVADIIPTPADAVYFHLNRYLRDLWKQGTITPQSYWFWETASYYSLNPIWWGLVFLILLSTGKTAQDKLKILLALIGSGAVVGVLYQNVKRDVAQLQMDNQIVQGLSTNSIIAKYKPFI